jgi:hypothetical protein
MRAVSAGAGGIAKTTAVTIVAELGSLSRFAKAGG